MATENVNDWDEALPSSETDEGEEEEDADPCSAGNKKKRDDEKRAKLESYVKRMAYTPAMPPKFRPRTEEMARHRRVILEDNYDNFKNVWSPKLRAKRVRKMLGKYNAITTEQLESIVQHSKTRERDREQALKRKQEIYFSMLTKLERQCRTQYLNVLIKKFSKFISQLATTMRIPPQLVDPYARMQRGIFCNILLAIGMQPTSQSAIYYTSQDAIEYDVCHRLAHALLSLIIKALDAAASREPEAQPEDGAGATAVDPCEADYEMDNYIKDRLMCAAEKKIMNERRQRRARPGPKPLSTFDRCENFECDDD